MDKLIQKSLGHLRQFVQQRNNPVSQAGFEVARRSLPFMQSFNVVQDFADAFSKVPKFDFADKFKNPVANFAAQIPQSILNSPMNSAQGIQGLNKNFIDLTRGQFRPQEIASNLAKTADLPLNLMTGGAGYGVAKQIGTQGFKQVLKQGAKQGAKYGAGYGALGGLESGRDIVDPQEYLKNLGINIGLGTVAGAGIGVGGPLLGKAYQVGSRRVGDIQRQQSLEEFAANMPKYLDAPKLDPIIAKYRKALQVDTRTAREIGQAVTDTLGGFMDRGFDVLERSTAKYLPQFRHVDTPTKAQIWDYILARKMNLGDVKPHPLIEELDNAIFKVAGFDIRQGGFVKFGEFKPPYKKGDIKKLESYRDELLGNKSTRSVQALSMRSELEDAAARGNDEAKGLLDQIVSIEKDIDAAKLARDGKNVAEERLTDMKFYHGTSAQSAEAIKREGFKIGNTANAKDFGEGVYITPSLPGAQRYGGTVIETVVDPSAKIKSVDVPYNITRDQGKELADKARKEGFEGLRNNHPDLGESVVIFDPKKVSTYKPNVAQQQIGGERLTDITPPPALGPDVFAPQTKAQKRLKNLLTYDRELADLGYTPQQIKMINAVEARKIIDGKIPPPAPRGQLRTKTTQTPETYGDRAPLVSSQQKGQMPQTPLQRAQQVRQSKPVQHIDDQPFEDIVQGAGKDVKSKIAIWDYLRTPDRVLNKIGLGNEARHLRQKYDNYLEELPKNIEKITEWAKIANEPDSAKRIFQYLDGQEFIPLSKTEERVANEIRDWLGEWANRLKLPEDKRITNYITHIFEKDFIQKEFDPDLAKIIDENVAGSVYDPFTQQRLGKQGYIEDVWRALDAYVKRATRKVHMDEALEQTKRAAEALEIGQYKYLKSYIDRVNMRPTEIDNIIDNSIKAILGYRFGQRPMANISKKARQMVYRATLGLNPGSALRNLSQGANTYAKLGERYTALGYATLVKNWRSDELQRVGVLRDDFIQDRTLNATRKFWENTDKVLFSLFQTAEKINRGAAYYGAKAKGISQGMNEKEAIDYARGIVRDTQFTFGSVDTPPILQSDLGKTLGQFQSFTLKQGEFLGEMLKAKDVAGLTRWTIASLLYVGTVGKLFGMKPEQIIPTFRFDVPATLQLPVETVKAALNTEDDYGQERDLLRKAEDIGKAALLYVPGSVQAKKTIGGVKDVLQGHSESRSGRVRFPIEQSPTNLIRGALFGTNNLPEAREYFDNDGTVLGEKQSEQFKRSGNKQEFYSKVMTHREKSRKLDEVKKSLENGEKVEYGDALFWLDDDGSMQTVELSEKARSGQGIDAFDEDHSPASKARKIWSAPNDQVTPEEKEAAFKKLGFTTDQVRYDYMTSSKFSVSEKAAYIQSKNMTHDQLIQRLITGRVESVSGNLFASEGVLKELRDAGLISYAEYSALNKLRFNSDGTVKASSGSGRKGRVRALPKVAIPKGKAFVVPKTKLAKIDVRLGKKKGAKGKSKLRIQPKSI